MPRGYYPRKLKRTGVVQPDDNAIRYIPLTKGLVAIVDAENFDRLSTFNWSADSDSDGRHYPVTTLPRQGDTRQRKVKMHRFLLEGDFECIDHINRDPLDNRLGNLRGCTFQQNSANRSLNRNNTSGAKGVFKVAGYNRWRACIRVAKRTHHLGYFPSAEEAAAAYDRAAIKLLGNYAATNAVLA
ncbi:HNH endonuclease [Terriglobus sp. ADX1]|uniref:HNH endonuclease n=1 Tax=Terriglobus sp. ADX1 TaxID=2794063 RepID=UPI002FE6B057